MYSWSGRKSAGGGDSGRGSCRSSGGGDKEELVLGRAQMEAERRGEVHEQLEMELDLSRVVDIPWTPASHKHFSDSFRRMVMTLLCCLNRRGAELPLEMIIEIMSHFSFREDLSHHVFFIPFRDRFTTSSIRRNTRIYSLTSNPVALDVVSTRDCDGELRILVGVRKYPNDHGMNQMSITAHDHSNLLFWRRLRDGSDFSWRTTVASDYKLNQFKRSIFGNNSDIDIVSLLQFLKQF